MRNTLLRRSMATIARLNHDGSKTTIQIRPSYPHKPKAVENLMKALPGLLEPKSSSAGNIDGAGVAAWRLDDSGDTIHRHVSLGSEGDVSLILREIEEVARELGHDPHVFVGGDGGCLTVSCTTHVPAGLSMKDVRLAGRVEQILKGRLVGVVSEEQVRDGEKRNMEAIRKAKEDCSCG